MRIGRVYDQLEPGYRRILADRLWPRGLRKNDPRVGQWWPQLAPSTELRQWYAHQPGRFDDFADRYRAELQSGEGAEALAALRSEEHTSELQSRGHLVCRLLLEKKKKLLYTA